MGPAEPLRHDESRHFRLCDVIKQSNMLASVQVLNQTPFLVISGSFFTCFFVKMTQTHPLMSLFRDREEFLLAGHLKEDLFEKTGSYTRAV